MDVLLAWLRYDCSLLCSLGDEDKAVIKSFSFFSFLSFFIFFLHLVC